MSLHATMRAQFILKWLLISDFVFKPSVIIQCLNHVLCNWDWDSVGFKKTKFVNIQGVIIQVEL